MTDATGKPLDRPFLLELHGVSKTYLSGSKRLEVLRHIDLKLGSSEMMAVVGSSGSGKTTLLNTIAGLDKPDEGSIKLDGRELTLLNSADWDIVRQRDIGFVFQFHQLLPEFTALENVMLPGYVVGTQRAALERQARDLLGRMGMGARLDHLPSQLSGGEQQRTAIARALINQPRLILADEPTGSLDQTSGLRVFDLLLELQQEMEISCLVVTHNPVLAKMCARIHVLDSLETPTGGASQVGVRDV